VIGGLVFLVIVLRILVRGAVRSTAGSER